MAQLRIFKFIGAYTLLGFVPLAVSFFLLPLYTTYLSPAEYGILTTANVTQTFIGLAINLGLDAAFGRFYFDYLGDERSRRRLLVTTIAAVTGLTVAVGLGLAAVGPLLFTTAWKELPYDRYGLLILLAAYAQLIYGLVFTWHRNCEALGPAVAVSLGVTAASTVGSAIAIVHFRADAYAAVAGKALGSAVGTLPFLLAVLRRGPFSVDLVLIKKMLAFGLPLVAYTVVAYGLFNADRIAVQRWFDLTTLGYYALAATMITPMELVLQSGQTAVQPVYYRRLAINQAAAERQIGAFFVLLVLLNIVGLVAAVGLAPPFLGLFKGAKYLGAALFLPMLGLSQLFRTIYGAFAFSMFHSKVTHPLAVVTGLSLVIAVAVAWPAARAFGPLGVALSTVAWKAFQQWTTAIAMRRLGNGTAQVEVRASWPWVYGAGLYVVGYYVVNVTSPRWLAAYSWTVGGVLALGALSQVPRFARMAGLFEGDEGVPQGGEGQAKEPAT